MSLYNDYSESNNKMLDTFKEHVHAEDDELTELRIYINSALSYVKHLINRTFSSLDEDEQSVFNMCVLQVATSWYLNRDGSSKGASNTYSAINPMIQTLRIPPIGGGSN